MVSWQMRLSHIVVRPMRWAQSLMARGLNAKRLVWFRHWAQGKRDSKPMTGINREVISRASFNGFLFMDNTSSSDEIVLMIHGGGFCFGWNRHYDTIAKQIVHLTGISVLAVDYPLAPEHQYPSAHEAVLAAYRWLIKDGYASDQITWLSDSAGSAIHLSLLQQLRDEKYPLPYASVLLSPNIDLTISNKSSRSKRDSFISPTYASRLIQFYVGNNDPKQAQISPIFGEFHRLPPMLVFVGSRDLLHEETQQLVANAKAANVPVELVVVKGVWHGWYLFQALLPEAELTLAKIAKYITED